MTVLTDRVQLERVRPADVDAVRAFLASVDLTLRGVGEEGVRLWIARAASGEIVGSTGYETSADGCHALLRSVAVAPGDRERGAGSRLARFALAQAAAEGASTAWLFSRRSGPFWQRQGFERADRAELARVLAATHQVRLFRETGQLDHEVAWTRTMAV